MALMIGCILHGLDALQGTRAKPGNHLVIYKVVAFRMQQVNRVAPGVRPAAWIAFLRVDHVN